VPSSKTTEEFVRPASDAGGNPKIVPRRPGAVVSRVGGKWPSAAIKASGERVRVTRYIAGLLRRGDLLRGSAPSSPGANVEPKPKKTKKKED